MTTTSWQQLYAEAQQAGGGAPVPPGTYDCIIETAEGRETQNGKPMIACKFKIITGPHAGKRIFNNFVLSTENANAMRFFFDHMAVLGVDQSVWPQLAPGVDGLRQIAPSLVGRQARIGGDHRTWQGRPQFDVKEIAPPTPGLQVPPEGGAAAPSFQPPAVGYPGQPQAPAAPQPGPAPVPQGWPPAQAPQPVAPAGWAPPAPGQGAPVGQAPQWAGQPVAQEAPVQQQFPAPAPQPDPAANGQAQAPPPPPGFPPVAQQPPI